MRRMSRCIQPRGGNAYYNLAIGSGDGGSAATAVKDRFYSIRDRQPFTRRAQSEYNALQPMLDSDLVDITTSPVGFRVPDYALGWRLDLGCRGKDTCGIAHHKRRDPLHDVQGSCIRWNRGLRGERRESYAVRADNGTAAIDLNRDFVITPADRSSCIAAGAGPS